MQQPIWLKHRTIGGAVAASWLLAALTACGGGGGGGGGASGFTPQFEALAQLDRKAQPATASSASACKMSTFAPLLPANATITSVTTSSSPVVYCRVRGTIVSTTPNTNTVNWSLSLPDNYSGRFIYEAPGGSAGSVGNPAANQLQRGFAVATSDHGTRPLSTFDFQWRGDPGQLLDYNLRAAYNTTKLAQALTSGYYAQPRPVSYMVGCSAGGRHVRNIARNYGTELFDGYLGAAPPSTASNTIMHTRIAQYMALNPSSWIPPALAIAGEELIIATYDAADGVVDGIITDERRFDFDPQILTRAGFTQEQIKLVEFIRASYAYLADPAPVVNDRKTPGFPIVRLREWTNWLTGTTPPPWTIGQAGIPNGYSAGGSTLQAIYGTNYDWVHNYNFNSPADFQRWIVAVGDNAGAAGYDYSLMARAGGKSIFYVGMGDSAQSFKETVVTRQEMQRVAPTLNIEDYSKVYLIPGWGHCGPANGGPAAAEVQDRMLDGLIGWVENKKAPTDILATRTATSSLSQRTFRLCPEPKTAVYKGGGADINSAESYNCQEQSLQQLFP